MHLAWRNSDGMLSMILKTEGLYVKLRVELVAEFLPDRCSGELSLRSKADPSTLFITSDKRCEDT